jgi:hypothetical protein
VGQGWSTCPECARPWVPYPAPQTNKQTTTTKPFGICTETDEAALVFHGLHHLETSRTQECKHPNALKG